MSGQDTKQAAPRRRTLKDRRLEAIKEGFPSDAEYLEASQLAGEMYEAVEGIEGRLSSVWALNGHRYRLNWLCG